MATALTGAFGKTLENFVTLLADAPEFQSFVAEVDAVAARTHVYLHAQDIGDWVRPACLVFFSEDIRQERTSVGNSDEYDPWIVGSVVLRFEKDVPGAYVTDRDEGLRLFWEEMEGATGVIQGLQGLAGGDGYPSVQRWRPVTSMPVVSDKTQGQGTKYLQWDWAAEVGS